MSHLSYEGQSKVDYCLECSEKHSQTAKVLMREALQRALVDSPQGEGVMEKVRGVVEELSGFEIDTETVKNDRVAALNSEARDIRKLIYASKAEIGGADVENLKEIKRRIDELVDKTYEARKAEEPCPTCVVKSEEKTEEKAEPLSKYGISVAEKRKRFLEQVRKEVPVG